MITDVLYSVNMYIPFRVKRFELRHVMDTALYRCVMYYYYVPVARQALEQLVSEGKIRSLGVSNFNSVQVDLIYFVSKVKPVLNQVSADKPAKRENQPQTTHTRRQARAGSVAHACTHAR